jgi:hypothetical protein
MSSGLGLAIQTYHHASTSYATTPQKIEAFAMKMTGLSQKRRIQQDQVAN